MISYRMIVLRNLSRPGLRYWSQYLPLLNIFGDVSIVPLESLYESLPVFPTKAPSNFSPFPSTSPEYLHRRYGGVGVPFRLWQGVSEGLLAPARADFFIDVNVQLIHQSLHQDLHLPNDVHESPILGTKPPLDFLFDLSGTPK